MTDLASSRLHAAPSEWNQSVSLVDQDKERRLSLDKFEGRMRQLRSDPSHYRSPSQRTCDFNEYMSRLMDENKTLVTTIGSRVRFEDPDVSSLKLKAIVFKELLETLRKQRSPKLDILPSRDLFRPILTLTNRSNKYRNYFHSGCQINGKWTCCQSSVQSLTSRGCDYTVVNPDAWCLLS